MCMQFVLVSKLTKCSDGSEQWKLPDGTLHRIGGPAITRPATKKSGAEYMYLVNGNYHRTNGPAKEQIDGKTGEPIYGWFLKGDNCYTFSHYCELLQLFYDKTDADIAAIRAAYPLANFDYDE